MTEGFEPSESEGTDAEGFAASAARRGQGFDAIRDEPSRDLFEAR